MWHNLFRRREEKECEAVGLLLARQLGKDPLSAAETARLESHLATCPACQERARQEQFIHGRFQLEMPPIHRLSPADAAHIQSQVQRRLWRKKLMIQSRQAVRGLAALVMLLLFTAAVFWWWQNYDLESLAPINPPVPEQTEATLTLAVPDGTTERYRTLAEAFMGDYEGIIVQIESSGDLTHDDPNPARALAAAADVFISNAQRHPAPHYLLDLRPFIEQDDQFQADDFYPNLLVEDNGRITTIPAHASYHLIYYDRDMFDAAAVPYPENGWTLDQFLTTAQQMTRREGDTVIQWGYVPLLPEWSPLLAAQLNTPVGKVDTPRFEDEDMVAAMQWLSELFTRHHVSPWLPFFSEYGALFGYTDPVVSVGQAALWLGSHTTYAQQTAFVNHLGVVAVPESAAGLFAEPLIHGYSISAGTSQPDAAWQLVSFLSRQPPVPEAFRDAVPARRSVATATDFWSRLPENVRSVLLYSVENTQPHHLWSRMWEMRAVLTEVVENDVPVAAAVQGRAVPLAGDDERITVATPEPTPVPAGTTVRFSAFQNLEAVRDLAQNFNQANPEITIIVSRAPDDDAYDSYDCYSRISWSMDQNIADRLIAIDALMDLDPTTDYADFYPGTWAQVRWDGQHYGLPLAIAPRVILYDRSKFEAAGLADPALNWTLDNFLEAAQALTTGTGDDKQYGFFDPYYRMGYPPHLHAMFNVRFFDASVSPPTFDFLAAEPAYRWYADLTSLYEVQPVLPVRSDNYSQSHTMIINGRHAAFEAQGNYAMKTEQINLLPPTAELERENHSIAAWPFGPSEANMNHNALFTIYYYINKNSEQVQACWQWISFLSGQTGPVSDIPARISVAESAEYEAIVGPQAAAVYRAVMGGDQLPDIAAPGTTPQWMRPGWLWASRALEQTLHGADLFLELERSQQQWDVYRDCVIVADAFDTREAWTQCAIEVDPALVAVYD
jgi:ABC-type glycerol-3-phosphate transport system substrate-binding protein